MSGASAIPIMPVAAETTKDAAKNAVAPVSPAKVNAVTNDDAKILAPTVEIAAPINAGTACGITFSKP